MICSVSSTRQTMVYTYMAGLLLSRQQAKLTLRLHEQQVTCVQLLTQTQQVQGILASPALVPC